MKRKRDLKETIEQELQDMLAAKTEPNEGRMKLLKLSIGFIAVQAKLEESEYGGFFTDGDGEDAAGVQEGPKPRRGRGANGARRSRAGGSGAGPTPDLLDGT